MSNVVHYTPTEIAAFANKVADKYQTVCERGATEATVSTALATIGGFFYDPDPTKNGKAEGAWNNLMFQQRGALGNLCQNASWMLENAVARRDKLMVELHDLAETGLNNEIDLTNAARLANDVAQLKDAQVPACEQWLELTKAAYEAITGEKWKPYAKKGKDAATQSKDALLATIAGLMAPEKAA
jgi:cell division septum initiation protein DivIVA